MSLNAMSLNAMSSINETLAQLASNMQEKKFHQVEKFAQSVATQKLSCSGLSFPLPTVAQFGRSNEKGAYGSKKNTVGAQY